MVISAATLLQNRPLLQQYPTAPSAAAIRPAIFRVGKPRIVTVGVPFDV